MRTDGVHCKESAGAGPLILKVAGVPPWTNFCASFFPIPTGRMSCAICIESIEGG